MQIKALITALRTLSGVYTAEPEYSRVLLALAGEFETSTRAVAIRVYGQLLSRQECESLAHTAVLQGLVEGLDDVLPCYDEAQTRCFLLRRIQFTLFDLARSNSSEPYHELDVEVLVDHGSWNSASLETALVYLAILNRFRNEVDGLLELERDGAAVLAARADVSVATIRRRAARTLARLLAHCSDRVVAPRKAAHE